MKQIKGGDGYGGTCASINSGGEVMYNQTKKEASAVGAGGHWCCDSCSSASWYCPDGGEFC